MTEPTLLAIHGMAGLGSLWSEVATRWSGEILTPDLAGHGSGPQLDTYGPEAFADELATRLALGAATGPLLVVGHSLGGVVALELARRHPELDITHLVAIGIKTTWTDEDIAGSHGLADKGVRWFDDELAARQRFVRSTGVADHIEPTDPRIDAGVVEGEGGWRTATDPEAYRVQPMDFAAKFASAPCPVTLARGADDAMVPTSDLDAFGPVIQIESAGHNAHIDNPTAVVELLDAARQ